MSEEQENDQQDADDQQAAREEAEPEEAQVGAESPDPAQARLYKDNAGEWRWDIISSNGEIIEDSSEGYKNKQDAEGAIAGIHGDHIQIVERGPKQNG